MRFYHALVATDGQSGPHNQVSLEAETLVQAVELFHARYGGANVGSVWGEVAAELKRDDAG
jgi:hypothetical protein